MGRAMQTLRRVLKVKAQTSRARLLEARRGGRQDSILRQPPQSSLHLLRSSVPLPAPFLLLSPDGVGALAKYELSRE